MLEGRPHIVDRMLSGEVQLVFNTTEGAQAIADSFCLRRSGPDQQIPYYTTVAGARAAVRRSTRSKRAALKLHPYNPILWSRFKNRRISR